MKRRGFLKGAVGAGAGLSLAGLFTEAVKSAPENVGGAAFGPTNQSAPPSSGTKCTVNGHPFQIVSVCSSQQCDIIDVTSDYTTGLKRSYARGLSDYGSVEIETFDVSSKAWQEIMRAHQIGKPVNLAFRIGRNTYALEAYTSQVQHLAEWDLVTGTVGFRWSGPIVVS